MSTGFTGIVLAGGLGSRMGAPKASLQVAGEPLIAYPVAALTSVCDRVAVVAKPATELPDLTVERWDEPEDPQHPIAGITHALERAGSPILVVAADMPFVDRDTLALLAAELQPGLKAVVAVAEGRLEPLLAAYAPDALEILRAAPPDEPLRRTVESLMPIPLDVSPDVAFNVNTPDDLAEAERRLRS